MKRWVVAVVLGLCAFGAWSRHHEADDALHGLWIQSPVRVPKDEMRFYYFHPGGAGLYRYGQAGYNQTHSFDWSVRGDEVRLHFRKTGETATTRIRLGGRGDERTLTMLEDPRGPGIVTYRRVPSALTEGLGPLAIPDGLGSDGAILVGRIWVDQTAYATGGAGFRMYQLSEHETEAGWRIGWHHLGDHDDWTTERFDYRANEGLLDVRFLVRGDEARLPISLDHIAGRARLVLERDPRNFLQRTRLLDGGPSF